MTNKQTATLSLQLLSVMDKLFTLAAPVSGPLLFFTGHPNHGQRVFVASQVAIQAQAECVTISAVGLHSGIAFVELLRGDDIAMCASLRTPDTVELGWTQRGENEPQVGAWKEGLGGREFLAEINEHCIVRRRAQAMEPHV